MNVRTSVLVVGVLLFILAGILLGTSVFDEPDRAERAAGEPARTRFTRPHFVGYHKGVRQWSLQAEVIEEETSGDPDVLLLDVVREGILYEEGREYLTFQADRGVYHQTKGDLELEGDVRFYEEGELLLASERVLWYGDDELLVAPTRVRVNQGGERMTADRLEARPSEDTVTMSGNVEWTNDDGVEVRAEHVVYNGDDLVFDELLGPVVFVLEEEHTDER